MSRQSCSQYIAEVERIVQFGGSRNEQTVRPAFQKLLDGYCQAKHRLLLAELDYVTAKNKTVRPDGTVKDQLRMSWGWWESKDEADDLDEEIAKKKAKGYPTENILFEDSLTAVLIQNGVEQGRVDMRDPAALDALLTAFMDYERPEVASFRAAVETFKADIPAITEALRSLIDDGTKTNTHFRMERAAFLDLLRDSVNPDVTPFDVDEMLIQHLLTEEIFTTVFDDALFHRYNIIAHRIDEILAILLTPEKRHSLLDRIQPYYKVIKASAAQIADIHEKQKFLKVIYENFYQAYNPKGADRLGVVYTPNEIVSFMLEATDHLLHRHFGKLLADDGVDILDPCTGTGTFITALIDRLPAENLKRKYPTEIHANEVAILPYYIANLNIEYTYKQKVGAYAPFPGICFVDTLDNNAFHYGGKQGELVMGVGAENIERIKKQNERKISVVIGNPPYNANQQNENDNNKNRAYPTVDKRIKDTYIAESTAQKTKLYDMYARFLRWASDRIDQNGVVAFVSNSSFVTARTFDGFRKTVQKEFNEVWIVNLKGDARAIGDQRRREGGNVFDDAIRVGVAIYFLIRKQGSSGCRIFYTEVADFLRGSDKKNFLRDNSLTSLAFAHLIPDKNANWLNLTDNDWDELVPLDDEVGRAVFASSSLGASTNRDDWVYAGTSTELASKVGFFLDGYERLISKPNFESPDIKLSDTLKRKILEGRTEKFDANLVQTSLYRPFTTMSFYYSDLLVDRPGRGRNYFSPIGNNWSINAMAGERQPFAALATKWIPNMHLFSPDHSKTFPLYTYSETGERRDNITDWALKLFQDQFGPSVSKLDIFHYVYAVLHNPAYRTTYEQNLKRELPRIPLYPDFAWWRDAGKTLMELHIGFETNEPWPLTVTDSRTASGELLPPTSTRKTVIRTDKALGQVEFATPTGRVVVAGFPAAVWDYKLGHRTALEWVLDQYADYTPKDPTVAAKFHTYRLADHLDEVVLLLKRVTRVSVVTVGVVRGMET